VLQPNGPTSDWCRSSPDAGSKPVNGRFRRVKRWVTFDVELRVERLRKLSESRKRGRHTAKLRGTRCGGRPSKEGASAAVIELVPHIRRMKRGPSPAAHQLREFLRP
jgi:hypothetical protein